MLGFRILIDEENRYYHNGQEISEFHANYLREHFPMRFLWLKHVHVERRYTQRVHGVYHAPQRLLAMG